MRYMPSLTYQIISFVYSAGLGFALGTAYDALKILFYLFTGSDKRFSVSRDLIYSFVCLAATFLFLLVLCDGKLYLYIFIGEGTGLFIYLYALSGIFILPVKRKIDKIKRQLVKIKNFFIRIKTKSNTMCKKICKKFDKRIKKSKKYLHNRYALLYNFSVKLCSQKNELKNRGDENG